MACSMVVRVHRNAMRASRQRLTLRQDLLIRVGSPGQLPITRNTNHGDGAGGLPLCLTFFNVSLLLQQCGQIPPSPTTKTSRTDR